MDIFDALQSLGTLEPGPCPGLLTPKEVEVLGKAKRAIELLLHQHQGREAQEGMDLLPSKAARTSAETELVRAPSATTSSLRANPKDV
jgi:hypothetical protein